MAQPAAATKKGNTKQGVAPGTHKTAGKVNTKAAAPQEEEGIDDDGGFPTPEIKPPSGTPDAFQGRIAAVTSKTSDNDYTFMIVHLESDVTPGVDHQKNYFPPQAFVRYFDRTMECLKSKPQGKIEELVDENGTYLYPKEKTADPDTGKLPFNSEYDKFATTVANNAGTSEFESLRAIAKKQGRTFGSQGISTDWGTWDDFVAAYNELLTGVEVVFVRRPKGGGDPRFAGRLQVSAIYGPEVWDESPAKVLKNYVRPEAE